MNLLIILAGKMRSGKNTFATMLKNELEKYNLHVKEIAFADTLKEWCSEDFKSLINIINEFCDKINPNPYDANLQTLINEIKTTNDNWFENKNKITRAILQIIGTELVRKRIDPNFWINELIKKIQKLNTNFIITDARFPNESCLLPNITNFKTITIKINRNTGITSNHPSETALDSYDNFDYIIDNNDTLEVLKQSAITITNNILEEK